MRIWDRLQAWVSRADQRCYYWILTLALLLPNVVLSVVMQQPAVGRVLNILLMLPVYMLLLLSAKRPGRVYWGLFVLVLLHAFQLVLLTIFSGSVVAVDMLLNIFTSEPDEAGELLSNILWPILASGGFYALTFVVATLSARSRESLSPRFRRRMSLVSALILGTLGGSLVAEVLAGAVVVHHLIELRRRQIHIVEDAHRIDLRTQMHVGEALLRPYIYR